MLACCALLAALVLSLSLAGQARPAAASAAGWRLAFDDEFTGRALSAVWTPGWFGTGVTGPVATSEHACYSSALVSVSGGLLRLRLEHAASTCRGHREPWTGALVSTDGHFSWAGPAKVSVRAFIPAAGRRVAAWPAIWSDGQSWPADGETDLMEGLDGATCWYVHTSAAPGGAGGCTAVPLTGWHVFTGVWQDGMVRLYYDGRLAGTEPYRTGNAPQYVVLENTVGRVGVPDVMLVDWVRVWRP